MVKDNSAPVADVDALYALTGACVCLAVRKAARRITQQFDEALAPTGLTVGQFALLGHCIRYAGASLQMIANKMDMDHSTLSRSLRLMERDGLVRLNASRNDSRVKEVRATAKGVRVFEAAAPAWRAAQCEAEERLAAHPNGDLRSALRVLLAAVG